MRKKHSYRTVCTLNISAPQWCHLSLCLRINWRRHCLWCLAAFQLAETRELLRGRFWGKLLVLLKVSCHLQKTMCKLLVLNLAEYCASKWIVTVTHIHSWIGFLELARPQHTYDATFTTCLFRPACIHCKWPCPTCNHVKVEVQLTGWTGIWTTVKKKRRKK